VRRSVADIAKARRTLGLAEPTSLDAGLRTTWDWFAATAPSRPASAARFERSHS
jgi:nucleoside-diphosphate-sugar epimerase